MTGRMFKWTGYYASEGLGLGIITRKKEENKKNKDINTCVKARWMPPFPSLHVSPGLMWGVWLYARVCVEQMHTLWLLNSVVTSIVSSSIATINLC